MKNADVQNSANPKIWSSATKLLVFRSLLFVYLLLSSCHDLVGLNLAKYFSFTFLQIRDSSHHEHSVIHLDRAELIADYSWRCQVWGMKFPGSGADSAPW